METIRAYSRGSVVEGSRMSEEVHRMRTRIDLGEYTISNTRSSDFPGNYPGYNDEWNFEGFKEKFRVEVVSLTEEDMEFDMVGIDASLANAFRRILLAEVPTMAIEKVFIMNNTSLIQDEVLAHRLGLLPIKADPRRFQMLPSREDDDPFPDPSPEHMLQFSLNVKCKMVKGAKEGGDPSKIYVHSQVTTKDMKWNPLDGQETKLFDIRPVHDDILIAKLRPGQEIDVRLLCVKGIGQDHAKFSPVATASYRLLPEITLTRPVVGEQASRLAKCFSKGVVRVVKEGGEKRAEVVHPRKDTCSREVLRHEDLRECVRLSRVRDHYIFSIESTGALPPNILMEEAVKILKGKCEIFLQELSELT